MYSRTQRALAVGVSANVKKGTFKVEELTDSIRELIIKDNGLEDSKKIVITNIIDLTKIIEELEEY